MKSGVYKITNISNKKIYIGSSKRLGSRWSGHKHKLRLNQHHCRHLQFSWNKYGESSFIFEVLEYCEPIREILLTVEQKYLDLLLPEYNSYTIAGSNKGNKLSEEHKLKISLGNKGKIMSEESRKRMSLSHMGKIIPDEVRLKISKSEIKTKSNKHTLIHKDA